MFSRETKSNTDYLQQTQKVDMNCLVFIDLRAACAAVVQARVWAKDQNLEGGVEQS